MPDIAAAIRPADEPSRTGAPAARTLNADGGAMHRRIRPAPLSDSTRRIAQGRPHPHIPRMDSPIVAQIFETLYPHPRGLLMLRARYGLDGNPPQPLEAIATEFGVTRERVRQLLGRTMTIQAELSWYPAALAAYEILRQFDEPIPLSCWSKRLPETLRGAAATDLRGIRLVAALTGQLPTAWAIIDGIDWVQAGDGDPKRIVAQVRTAQNALQGVTRRFAVAADLERVGAAARSTARRLIDASPDWVALQSGWIVASSSDRQQCSVMRLMLTVLGPLTIPEIRRGLERTRVMKPSRLPMVVPDAGAMREILVAAGFDVDSRDVVGLGKMLPLWPEAPTVNLLIDVFRREGSPVSRNRAIEAGASQGIGAAAVAAALSFSPLFARVAPSEYALRTSGVLDMGSTWIRGPVPPHQRLVSDRVEENGTLVLRFDLTGPEVRERYPRGNSGIATGTWWLQRGRNSSQPIEVRQDRIDGLDDVVASARSRGARAIELSFERSGSAAREVGAIALVGRRRVRV